MVRDVMFYFNSLKSVFNASDSQAWGILKYLKTLVMRDVTSPDDYLENSRHILFGSIFSQIERGGEIQYTPEGRRVRVLTLFCEAAPFISEDGTERRRYFTFCPEFGLGDIVVQLRNTKDVTDVVVPHGISRGEGKSMKDLLDCILEVQKEMA